MRLLCNHFRLHALRYIQWKIMHVIRLRFVYFHYSVWCFIVVCICIIFEQLHFYFVNIDHDESLLVTDLFLAVNMLFLNIPKILNSNLSRQNEFSSKLSTLTKLKITLLSMNALSLLLNLSYLVRLLNLKLDSSLSLFIQPIPYVS